jgi:uncharacterized protein
MGYEDRRLIFAGAGGPGMGTPWGTLGSIAKRILEPLGYHLRVEAQSHGANNARYVGDGMADLGATHASHAIAAFHGREAYSGEEPRRSLRVIACISHPSWIGIAVRSEIGIQDLGEVRERRLAVRVKASGGPAFQMVWDHFGLSRELIESWGGQFLPTDLVSDHVPWVRSGEFDLFVDTVYAAYTPEARHWWEASVLHDLRFLALPEALIDRIVASGHADRGHIPVKLLRGVNENVTTVARLPQVIYTRDDMPEDFAYLLAKALDENRALLRQVHIPFSYDPANVGRDLGIPLHPGAERYYREKGYLD